MQIVIIGQFLGKNWPIKSILEALIPIFIFHISNLMWPDPTIHHISLLAVWFVVICQIWSQQPQQFIQAVGLFQDVYLPMMFTVYNSRIDSIAAEVSELGDVR